MGLFRGNRQKLTEEERVEFQKTLKVGQTISDNVITLRQMNKSLGMTELRKEIRLAGFEYRSVDDCPTCNNKVLQRR